MDILSLYIEVESTLKELDFEALHPGFKPYKFALYTDEVVCIDHALLPKTDAFLGNTAITFNGHHTAIWKVENKMDSAVLASKIVHEMFHAYQKDASENRFANEFEYLFGPQADARYFSWVKRENECLVALVEQFDEHVFQTLLQLRKKRLLTYGDHFMYNAKTEQIEGSANHVEMHALYQLDKKAYAHKLKEMCSRILTHKIILTPRIMSYDTGALLLHVLKTNHISFDNSFSDTPFVYSLINDTCPYSGDIEVDEMISNALEEEHMHLQKTINEAVMTTPPFIVGTCEIKGLNVYDAKRLGDYLVLTHFLMISHAGEDKVLYGDFVVKIDNYNATHIYYAKRP